MQNKPNKFAAHYIKRNLATGFEFKEDLSGLVYQYVWCKLSVGLVE